MGIEKPLTKKEKAFAKALFEGVKPSAAARSIFSWKCEPYSHEAQAARDLARAKRVKAEIERLKVQDGKQAQARGLMEFTEKAAWTDIRAFAFDRLIEIRDNPEANAQSRHRAIIALEQLQDPSRDVNLIFRWLDILWRYYSAHCPSCHTDFPLWKVKNLKLERYWLDNEIEWPSQVEDPLLRRLELLERGDPGRPPHQGQIPLIAAEERHVIGLGPARCGKSKALGMFGFMYMLIPGIESWILSQTYEMCRSEFEYIVNYLNTLFNPIGKHIFKVSYDKKTDEGKIDTQWGTLLVTKSGKSKASITGRELEAALVAEPAWVDDELYEEVRARMSSRLGRIIALGTPKGFGGFLNRMVQSGRRNVATGKKIDPASKLIKNGCPWGSSLYQTTLVPADNPEYVKSELEAAKAELTEAEYRSEFGGEQFSIDGAKFPYIQPKHLVNIPYDALRRCHFVQGIDQGEKNFGGCTIAWDGHTVYFINEFFDNTELTIKHNMQVINNQNPYFIKRIGGAPDNWKLTIFDADPPVYGILSELKREQKGWKTEYTLRPKNKADQANWRQETCMWINEMARQDRLWFSSEYCDLLHAQFLEVLNKPEVNTKDKNSVSYDKGWIVRDPWRNDHVLDAALLACYTIYSGELEAPASDAKVQYGDAFQEMARARELRRMMDEKRELTGLNDRNYGNYNKMFEDAFGRSGPQSSGWDDIGVPGFYEDES